MFFDDKRKTKVNLGNRNITSKEDFLKKIKKDKTKEQEKAKVNQSNLVLDHFFKGLKTKTQRMSQLEEGTIQTLSTLLTNMRSVIGLVDKEQDPNRRERIIIACLNKINKELSYYLLRPLMTGINQIEIIKHFQSLFKPLSNQTKVKFINENKKLMKTLISISVIDLYKALRKDLLVEDHVFFPLVSMIHFQDDSIKNLYMILSKNISFLYILNQIGRNMHKILEIPKKNILLNFLVDISTCVAIRRKNFKMIQAITFATHKICDALIETTAVNYLDNIENKHFQLDEFQIYVICTSIKSQSYLQSLNGSKFYLLLSHVANTLENLEKNLRKILLVTLDQEEMEFFTSLFKQIQHYLGTKLKVDRKVTLKYMNVILEFIFESTNVVHNPVKYEKFILLIYHSGKFIEYLYYSNFEKTSFYSILDFILNKVAHRINPGLSDAILRFSVDLLPKKNLKGVSLLNSNSTSIVNSKGNSPTNFWEVPNLEEIFEIISFIILSKIEYKENYFFIEFQSTQDIYKNLPFNFMYLNICSKFLLSLFTTLISKTHFEDLSNLQENIIIKCLKSLYRLDSEIEFTVNRDAFWTNMELVGKLSTDKHQIEKMKVMPFIFPFLYRLNALNTEAERLKKQAYNTHASHMYDDEYQHGFDVDLRIPREHIFDTTLGLYLNNRLKPYVRWRITFIDKFGNAEPGVDAGGLYKEFLFKLSEQAFNTNTGLFIESSTGFLMPNPNSQKVSEIHLKIFEFLGFIVGTGIVDDVKLAPNLSEIFLNNILEVENSFTELKSYDYDLYKNLLELKNYVGDVENDFGLNFTITEERDGKVQTLNLIDDGQNINVTNSNRLLYIKKVTEFKLSYQFKDQCEAFRRGLFRVVDEDLIKVFTADELRQLIYGFDKNALDVIDLKANTLYENWNFNSKQHINAINSFWEILDEFEDKEKEKFLFFVTSLKRAPIGGFKKLNPKFKLARSGKEVPTSSTCTNMLLLPVLPKEKMKEILRYVINADAGFYYA